MSNDTYKNGEHKQTTQNSFGPKGNVGSGEKAQNFTKTIGQLASYCKKYMLAICLAVILAILGAIMNIIGPGQLSKVTDLITEGMLHDFDLQPIINILVVLAMIYCAGFVFSLLQGIIMATITQKTSKSLRKDISIKINRLPLRYFDQNSIGDVLSRVTNDVDMIGQTLNQSLCTLVTSTASFIGALIMMFYTNWIMALSAVASTIIGFILMSIIISHSQKYFTQQQQELGCINGHIEETYAGHNVVKAYNGEKEAKTTFRNMNKRLYTCAWKSQFMSGVMQPLMMFIGNFGYVVVCIVGAILALNGTISFGVIVAFMLYIRLFTQPLSQLAQATTNLQSTAAASERVFAFLEEPEMEDESQKHTILSDIKGNVSFRHVHFGYTPDKTIIHDFSAEVKAGQKIAIVGPTGAGKSTMVNLLMRFYEIQKGDILIDGTSIHELTRENLHRLFCMVLQDTWLFNGTIKENIIYSKKGVSDKDVIDACKAVGLHHFIQTLPQGYDTILHDNDSLSAGQKQLITIARAMIENAPMLILDEATSSVDTRTEILIQNAMDKLMVDRTSFVIAHRLSTIRNSDLILVMENGDIIESGTHDALLQKKGFYASLYNSQFEDAS